MLVVTMMKLIVVISLAKVVEVMIVVVECETFEDFRIKAVVGSLQTYWYGSHDKGNGTKIKA